VDSVWSVGLQVIERVTGPFLSSGSAFSLTSLGCALAIAVAFIALRLRRRKRSVRVKVIMRALFPRCIACASSGVDFSYLIFNTFIFGVIFGWALLSYRTISSGTFEALNAAFAQRPATELPELASRAIVTLAMFLAYELGYWVHHYLCHRVAFLWEFHKVHHTANVLTPMTVFRVHPVDSWLFVVILAFFVGVANGATTYALGVAVPQFTLTDTNLILVVFIHVYIHFQHSHLWIAFRGAAGRVLLSPAHHQIHHSNNPAHFNKNLGSCLAIWDWLFGTLHIPEKSREKLQFGVEPTGHDVQTITEAYLTSFGRAAGTLRGAAVVPDETAAAADLNCAGNKAPA
jgi:sterol desaturase/sphingolipid hydroxylase (fatty acid hydroxylase superfamily)